MKPLIHRIYDNLRPLLEWSGLLALIQKLFSKRLHGYIDKYIGLGGYQPQEIIKTRPELMKPLPRDNYARLNITGINFIGDLRIDIGIGESSRIYVAALKKVNIEISYWEIPLVFSHKTNPLPANLKEGISYPFTFIHINAPEIERFLDKVPKETIENRYVIAIWYWELPKLPASWQRLFPYLDEIWVASRYSQETFASFAPVPVTQIPLAVNMPVSALTKSEARKEFNLPEDRFIFFFSYSQSSTVARKNPFGFIEAFLRAFQKPNSGPLLVLKVHHSGYVTSQKLQEDLKAAINAVGGVMMGENLSRLQMNNLLNLCDCYVSLHRSEGFGLGMIEAMSLGKPVIATAYSANTDYMTDDNSFKVRYKLREITEEDHQYQAEYRSLYELGQMWAEPDLDHAAELMKTVYQNRELAYRVGAQAQKDIQTQYNLEVMGKRISHRLEQIAKNSAQTE